jgi:hypothetical protein
LTPACSDKFRERERRVKKGKGMPGVGIWEDGANGMEEILYVEFSASLCMT